jgi:hypothetical protein
VRAAEKALAAWWSYLLHRRQRRAEMAAALQLHRTRGLQVPHPPPHGDATNVVLHRLRRHSDMRTSPCSC